MKNILIKKTKKYFLHIIFIHKNGKKILSKTQKKSFKKKHMKDIKIFLKKEKKTKKGSRQISKSF